MSELIYKCAKEDLLWQR